MSVLIACLGLVLAAPSPAPTESAVDARAVLEQVTRTYREFETYQFEGVIRLTLNIQGQNQSADMPFLLAAAKPGRFRTEMTSPLMSVVRVSDGEQTWVFLPQFNQYVHQVASTLDPAGAGAGAAGTPLTRYVAMTEDLESATIVGRETVEFGGASVNCLVIEARYHPAGSESPLPPIKVWVDPSRHLVLREVIAISPTPGGPPADVEQSIVFSGARWGQPLPDSLFTFDPPAGAQKVDDFSIPGMTEPDRSGQPAASFTLNDLRGKSHSLESWRGKVVLLEFWASWCAPCRKEMPVVAKLHQELKSRGLVVVAVNVGESAQVAERFIKRYQYGFDVLLDQQGEVADLYGASGLPTVVIIDREGRISSHFVGLRTEDVLRAALKKAGVL